jgi:hypothetical protein
MKITCSSCGNHNEFIVPLWVRCTFRFNEDGTITILHVKQLESLEEKLTNQNLTCPQCGNKAKVEFNEYEALEETMRARQALEAL